MNRDEIFALAIKAGFTLSRTEPVFSEMLADFANAVIKHYKDSVLKEVGEPIGKLFIPSDEFLWPEEVETESFTKYPEDYQDLFTADQLIAATKPLEEEIERLNRQVDNFNELDRKLEDKASMDLTSMPDAICELRQQLAAAQEEWNQCSGLLDDAHRSIEMLEEQLATAEQRVAEYNELIYAVQTKTPDETRHQTALRYIRNAENRPSNATANGASS